MSSIKIKVTPLSGAQTEEPLCYLLEVDQCRILLDCGWDTLFNVEMLELLANKEQMPEKLARLVEQAGGIENINRHVSGQSLCWGLREYALRLWGPLAGTVLSQQSGRSRCQLVVRFDSGLHIVTFPAR